MLIRGHAFGQISGQTYFSFLTQPGWCNLQKLVVSSSFKSYFLGPGVRRLFQAKVDATLMGSRIRQLTNLKTFKAPFYNVNIKAKKNHQNSEKSIFVCTSI
jgi:hypothetical protein